MRTKTYTGNTTEHRIGMLTYIGNAGVASIVTSSTPLAWDRTVSRYTLRLATDAEIAAHEAAYAEQVAATRDLNESLIAAYGAMGGKDPSAAELAALDRATSRMQAANAAMAVA